MKKVITFLIIIPVLFFVSCKVLGIKNYHTDRSVFANNAILADQNYYTRAVMDYYLLNSIISEFGSVYESDRDPDNPLNKNFKGNIQRIDIPEPVKVKCDYKRPDNLEDLESGFQYRYYLFTGEAKASMQAFGITDIDASRETTYLVIDYLQFKDIKCEKLPKIRYAIGLRSELKINYFSSGFKFKGVQSLKNLAAKVELDQAEAFFSLKTIGITGTEARFNIPQGVSFDVTTYKDFQNAIEFVKTKIDQGGSASKYSNDSIKNFNDIFIKPEIIPVMDDYRPNLRATIGPLVGEIKELSRERNRIINTSNRKIDSVSKEKIVSLINSEINNIINERKIYDSLYFKLSISVADKISGGLEKISKDRRDYSNSNLKLILNDSIQDKTAVNLLKKTKPSKSRNISKYKCS